MDAAAQRPLDLGEVVQGGYCVGCGACSFASGGKIPMRRNELLAYEADPSGFDAQGEVGQVCPFTGAGPNETEMADEIFGGSDYSFDERTGYFSAAYAGRISDPSSISASSSGGLTSWLLLRLLDLGMIDGVIHVGPRLSEGEDALFGYRVSESVEDITSRKKSQYYSTNFADAVRAITGNGKRYAFVGVPCFVKSMRLLLRNDSDLAKQIPFLVGLVCGHLKSGAFSEVMSYQLGVEKENIGQVDFRVKNPSAAANAYDFGVRELGSDVWRTSLSRELMGGNWGHALFQLKACDFCDDIFAEVADICFGDAWLPDYEADWRGTNLVLVRSAVLKGILEAGLEDGGIVLEQIDADAAAQSQDGNFRHRRDGLSLRLQDALARGERVPVKRVAPGSRKISYVRRSLIRLRQEMATQSHLSYQEARAAGNMNAFFACMRQYARRMEKLYQRERLTRPRTFVREFLRRAKALVRRILPGQDRFVKDYVNVR
jgi:coenzyme F420 hydrogenase subunit beta